MELVLSSPRGFCAGVVRAIETVERVIKKYGAPIYVKHEIVHNKYIVDSLASKGAITVENLSDIPNGSVVVFSAHGSSPQDFALAKRNDLIVIDATCPLVTRVHNEAIKYHGEGKKIILIGHKNHAEVLGTMGQAPMELVDDTEDIDLERLSEDSSVVILTQTTLSVDDTANTVQKIQDSFEDVLVRNDICYATSNRQLAVKELAQVVDLVLVIGSDTSSNCNRLREVAEKESGRPAYLISDVTEIQQKWLKGVKRVGITSGASTPEYLIDQVISTIKPDKITTIEGITEDVTFTLPREIQ